MTPDQLAWLRHVAERAADTWVGRNWPSMEAMRRDGIGHGLVEKSGRPDQAIRRYLDTFQPLLMVDLLADLGWRVHNHGPEEGGVACREYRLNGRLVGACLIEEATR